VGSDLSTVLCTRDTYYLPTIAQLYAIVGFLSSSDIIDEETHDLLDKEFDKLAVDDDGHVRVDDDIEIGYWAKKFPYYSRPAFLFCEGNRENPSFQMAEKDEFDDYHGDFEKLRKDLLANKRIAEFESRLSTILGTEVVSATCGNGSFIMPQVRSEQGPVPSPSTLPPFLIYMNKEQIMDMKDARDYHGLVRVLRVKDEELRTAAAKALASILYDDDVPHSAIGAELMRLMEDPDPSVRKAAVQARGIIVDPWAVVVIEVGLQDADEGVRKAAKAALPEAMSVWRKASKKEMAKRDFELSPTRSVIQLDESLAASLGFKIGDVVKCRDRDSEGEWTTLFRQFVKPPEPRPDPSVKVWRNY